MNDPIRSGMRSLPLQLFLFTFARLLIDTSYRMVYPYLATFQSGLGISLTAISVVLTVRALTGFIGPIFAPLADLRGRRAGMLLGFGVFIAGATLIVVWPGFTAFFIGSILMATSSLIYNPAMQAFFSDRVPFEKRGRIIGITELSWSVSFLVGVPLIGLLLERTSSWTSPFIFLAVLGATLFAILFIIIPRKPHVTDDNSAGSGGFNLRAPLKQGGFGAALGSPGLLIGLAMAALMTTANESVNIVFGLWLENSFQLQLVALGGASLVIGIGELGGGGMSALIADRLGKQRAVGLGLLLNCLSALFLVFFIRDKSSALAGLFFFYLTFEFAVVSVISLMSEAVPGLRATALATTISLFSVGRAVGSALGPFLFSTFGFPFNGAAAVIFNLGAILLLTRLKIGQKKPPDEVQTMLPPV